MRSPHTLMKNSPRSPQLEKALKLPQGSQKLIFKKQMRKTLPLDFVAVESKVINTAVVAPSEAHRGWVGSRVSEKLVPPWRRKQWGLVSSKAPIPPEGCICCHAGMRAPAFPNLFHPKEKPETQVFIQNIQFRNVGRALFCFVNF